MPSSPKGWKPRPTSTSEAGVTWSAVRDRYSTVKLRVVATAGNLTEYGQGKNTVIQEILAAAGLTEDERKVIDAAQVPSHEEVPR